MNKLKLLIIEDNAADVRLIDIYLGEVFPGKYTLDSAGLLAEAFKHFKTSRYDAVLCDLSLPDSDGLNTFHSVVSACPECPVIVLTGHGDNEFGLLAVSHGAADFLNKNKLDSNNLHRSIMYCIERNNLQKQLIASVKAKEAAEQASRIRHEFLSVMSHEIRTPLNGIMGTAQLLSEEDLTPAQKEHLNVLQFSVNNLQALINNVLDFSKIESGKIVLEKISFNLNELVNGIVNSFRPIATEKKLTLLVDIEKNLPEWLIGDPTRLTQVLNNLLHNAIKFTERGEVRVHIEALSKTDDEVKLLFEIKDTGLGIEHNYQRVIFEDFVQANPSITRKFGGTGLGLNICKKLVKLMGGDIRVQSEIGKGSSFYFTLVFPVDTKGGAKHLKTDSTKNFKLNGAKILVVEDNLTNQMLTQKFLTRWGAAVDTADNGEQAIEKIKQNKFDLVLMDLQMPVMNGFEANKKIREMGISRNDMRIVALTAYAMDEDKQRVLQAGMDDFIAKPINIHDLYQKIVKNIPNKTFHNGDEMEESISETGEVLSLPDLLDTFEDNEFRIKYLDLLLEDYKTLPQKVTEAIEQSNANSLSMTVHKISPSLKRLEENEMLELLAGLKAHISAGKKEEATINSALTDITNKCEVIAGKVSEIRKKYSN